MNISGKTDKGRRRSKNEDTFLVEPNLGVMIVADGMGGHAAGDVASNLAVQICLEQLKRSLQTGHVPVFTHVIPKPDMDPRSLILGDCIKFCNQAVFEAGKSNPATHNMGTTMVAALWLDDRLAVAHVGDSRLYILRQDRMIQCTVDHTFVQEQVDKGLIKQDEAEKSDMRNMLTRSVGVSDDVEVDVQEVNVAVGDYVLLCSDGLTKMLDDDQIKQVFFDKKEPQAVVNELIDRANQAGGGDNITAIVARLDESPSSWGSLTERLKGVFKKKAVRN